MATIADLIVDIDRETGELITGWPRCRQSIQVILTTRLRTRVMRRWFGSRFLELQDQPANEQSYNECLGKAINAINRYEPEFVVTRLAIRPAADGSAEITVEGTYLPEMSSRRTVVNI